MLVSSQVAAVTRDRCCISELGSSRVDTGHGQQSSRQQGIMLWTALLDMFLKECTVWVTAVLCMNEGVAHAWMKCVKNKRWRTGVERCRIVNTGIHCHLIGRKGCSTASVSPRGTCALGGTQTKTAATRLRPSTRPCIGRCSVAFEDLNSLQRFRHCERNSINYHTLGDSISYLSLRTFCLCLWTVCD